MLSSRLGRLTSVLAAPLTAFAASVQAASASTADGGFTCEINGRVLPADQCQNMFANVAAALGGFILVLGLLGLVTLGFLIHALTHPIQNKGIWIAALLLTGPVGVVMYIFLVLRAPRQQPATPAAPATPFGAPAAAAQAPVQTMTPPPVPPAPVAPVQSSVSAPAPAPAQAASPVPTASPVQATYPASAPAPAPQPQPGEQERPGTSGPIQGQ